MRMRRLIAVVCCAVLCASLSGCLFGGKKKPKDQQTSARAGSNKSGRTTESHEPFETMSDPPFNANTRFAAGQLAESQGDPNKAAMQYREALKLEPNHQQALFHLGALYTDQKKYDEAIKVWQHYVEVTDRSPAAYNNLAICFERAQRFEDAEKTYRAGIERDPNDSTCRVNYGLMLAKLGRTPEAIEEFKTVLTPAEIHYNLGSVCEQQGKKEQAKAYYQKALELDPHLRDARARLAALK